MRFAISSCLMGIHCKYSGGNNINEALVQYMKNHEVLLVCPEVLGGLPTPRASAEIKNGRVVNTDGVDITQQFEDGACKAIEQIHAFQPDCIITQSRSPSCGKGTIYDGDFQKKLINGNGKFVQKLLEQGFPVMDIQEFVKSIS